MSPPKLVGLLIVELVAMLALMGAVLFAAAGSWRWPGGWRFIALFGLLSLLLSLWLLWTDPALLQERLKPPVQSGQGRWDRAFMSAAVLTFLLPGDARDVVFRTPLLILVLIVGTALVLWRITRPGPGTR